MDTLCCQPIRKPPDDTYLVHTMTFSPLELRRMFLAHTVSVCSSWRAEFSAVGIGSQREAVGVGQRVAPSAGVLGFSTLFGVQGPEWDCGERSLSFSIGAGGGSFEARGLRGPRRAERPLSFA